MTGGQDQTPLVRSVVYQRQPRIFSHGAAATAVPHYHRLYIFRHTTCSLGLSVRSRNFLQASLLRLDETSRVVSAVGGYVTEEAAEVFTYIYLRELDSAGKTLVLKMRIIVAEWSTAARTKQVSMVNSLSLPPPAKCSNFANTRLT